MKKTTRKLTNLEFKLIKLRELNLLDNPDFSFAWGGVIWSIVSVLFFAYLLIEIDGFGWKMVCVVAIVFSFFSVYGFVQDYKMRKDEREEDIKLLPKVKENQDVEVWEIQCQQAFRFQGFNSEAASLVLDIGNNQLLGLEEGVLDSYYSLLCSEFSFLVDPDLKIVIGGAIKNEGIQILPKSIRGNYNVDFPADILPRHLEVINGTIEELLDKIISEMEG